LDRDAVEGKRVRDSRFGPDSGPTAPEIERSVVRSGVYEFDTRSGEVRKRGRPLKLQAQPREVLRHLVLRRGAVVTREELKRALWGDATWLDFDNGLNVAIRKVRDALGDSSVAPRYIETIPRRGYRFIADATDPVTLNSESSRSTAAAIVFEKQVEAAMGSLDGVGTRDRERAGRRTAWAVVGLVVAVAVAGSLATWRWLAVTREARLESVAVLPFVNLLGDPDRAYVVDGLTEGLLTELAAGGVPRVIPGRSGLASLDGERSAVSLLREMGVSAVVQGSVVRTGRSYVVNVQLIETASGRHRWAGRFAREGLHDITECADIAADLAAAMGLDATAARTRRRPQPAVRAEARDAYLRGLFFWQKRSGDDLKRALRYFTTAVEIEPQYAAAWGGVASVYGVGSPNSATLGLPEAEIIRRGEQAALASIRLDETGGEPHAALGRIRMAQWRWNDAERELRLAIDLSPNFATGHQWYGTLLLRLGRCDEALQYVTTGARLDPLAPLVNDAVAAVYAACGQAERAIEVQRGLLELHPNVASLRFRMATSLIRAGLHEDAIPEVQQAVRLDPDNCYYRTAGLAYALGRVDRRAEAQAIVDELIRSGRGDSARTVCLAAAYAAVGATDAVFASLERGFREHGAYMDVLIMAPWVRPYRRDPRYVRLLERMGMLESDVSRRAALDGPRFTTPIDATVSELQAGARQR
jgi:DNA-binding winged helix-turn-helix (wHTH) protein/TolB-like protein/tetratricopeptide (TPR) repeat protein